MNAKIFIAVVLAGVLANYLIFFATPDGSSLWDATSPVAHRVLLLLGFLLYLPVIPFTFLIGHFSPRWPAIYSTLCGTVLAAAFWSVVAHQVMMRVYGARA